MHVDISEAGRALEYIGIVAGNLVTLHSGFLLGFIVGVVTLRRFGAGSWGNGGYGGFVFGVTAVLLVGIVFLGLRLEISELALFVAGVAGAAIAWILAGGLPSGFRRRVASTSSGLWLALRRPRVPDRLPAELRTLRNRELR